MATSIVCGFFLGFAFCVTSTCASAEPQSSPQFDGSAHANAGRGPIRYFDLVNVAPSVTSLAVAPAGSGAFRDIVFGATLRRGLISITLQIPDDGCRHDFRVEFDDGRVRFYRDVDVCRYRQLRLMDREGRPGYSLGLVLNCIGCLAKSASAAHPGDETTTRYILGYGLTLAMHRHFVQPEDDFRHPMLD